MFLMNRLRSALVACGIQEKALADGTKIRGSARLQCYLGIRWHVSLVCSAL